MTETLKRLARIQRIHQDQAREHLADATAAQSAHEARLLALDQQVQAVRAPAVSDVDDLARRHAFVLRQEMLRRRMTGQSGQHDRRVATRRDALLSAARQVQVTEKFATSMAERDAEACDRDEQRQLDERGVQGWMRRSGGAS